MVNLSERDKSNRRIGRIQGFIGGIALSVTLANTGIEAKLDSFGETSPDITLSEGQYITTHPNVLTVFGYDGFEIPFVKTTRTNLTKDGSEISGVSIGGDIYDLSSFPFSVNKYHQTETEDGGLLYKDTQ